MAIFGNKGEQMYLAMIGDISGSRKTKDRAGLQTALEKAILSINKRMGQKLAARFVVTLGDEFQGLLRAPSDVVEALIRLEEYLPSIDVKYGIGWGTLSTELKQKAIGMDGPAYHRAREALSRGKERGRWVTASGFGEEGDMILNGIFGIIDAIRQGWTDRQRVTISKVRQSKTQKEAAAALGVVPSVVSEALTAARYHAVREAEDALALLLAKFGI
jgi:hypothetical protein